MGPSATRLSKALRANERLALDTAPFIYYLGDDSRRAPVLVEVIRRVRDRRLSAMTSVITEAELLVIPMRSRDRARVVQVSELLSGIPVREMGRATAYLAAEIRAEHRLRLPDAIVAASAIEAGCTALLGNDAAFRRIEDRITYLHLDDLIDDDE